MEFTLGSLIGIALATMFFGYFFGLYEGRAQGYRRRKKEEPLDRQAPVVVGKQAREPAPAPLTAPPAPVNAWLQLYADREGRPSLDLDGNHVDTSGLTLEQHQRLIQLMVVMRPWVEAKSHATGSPSASGGPEALASSMTGPSSGVTPGTALGSRGSLSAGMPGPAATPAPVDPGTPTSMVAQIDAILQARLQGTELASRGIRLAESLDGGVLVFVGQRSYPGVSDVPDVEVQAAIRAAISEWEKRYTPG
jgi:hypothetical protein